MRKVKEMQMKLGEVDIAGIQFDLRSRDEIPQLLMGLQHIWCTPELREQVFAILEKIVPKGTSPDTGRPGMELWKVLVLGTLRLNCNWDFDKVHEMANQHNTLRQMLGHAFMDQSYQYPIQTIKDNVQLLTPFLLDEINQVVVKAGHNLVKKNSGAGLKGRCDSFVVKTDVHFPTDINLLLDAVRKVIILTARLCSAHGIDGWRQFGHNLNKTKKLYRRAQRIKASNSPDEAKKAKQQEIIKAAYFAYLEVAQKFIERAQASIALLEQKGCCEMLELLTIKGYIQHGQRQMDQIKRRVLLGEVIPHNDKVFSIFEEHTEWISKGKAGVPQEFGLKVCIVEDQHRFILHHRVMEQETDDQIAVSITQEARQRFSDLTSCSYDKGFHNATNRGELEVLLDSVVLPKKGKLSQQDKEREHSLEFMRERRRHSGIESAINAVENHGLDRCLDHGLEGFKRYTALAVVARNMQVLGRILQQNELKRLKKRQTHYRLAA